MRLLVSQEARALGLLYPRAWRLSSERPLLDGEGLTDAQVTAAYDADAPLPAGYRKLLAELGYPDLTPAGERLRDVLRTRGWKSHGAVVDAVSAATLRHGAGIGLHHVSSGDDSRDLVVTRAGGGERITPAFSSKSRPIPAGDLVYGLVRTEGGPGPEPFAWLGRRDCDSAERQLTEESREALLVVLGCPGEDAAHSEAIGATVRQVLAALRNDVTFTEIPVATDRTTERPG